MLKLYRRVKNSTVLRNWHVRFSARGRQFRINLKTPDRSEALQKATEVYMRLRSSAPEPAPLSLSLFLEEYRCHLFATKARKTAQSEWSLLRAFFDRIPAATLKDVTTNLISTYIDRRLSEDKISPKTAYHIRQALHTLFNYAVRQKGFSRNPARDVPKPKVPLGEIRYLTVSQITQLLQISQNSNLRAPIAVAILAGLRRSEVVWLTWADVDLDRKRLSIRFKTVHGERYRPKTNKSRIVPISDELHAILSSLPRTSVWVFPSPTGKRWNPDNLSHRLSKFVSALGWDYTFLTFRHTFGSQLAQKGLSLYKISTLMGNSETVCRNHYVALAVDELQADVSILTSKTTHPPASPPPPTPHSAPGTLFPNSP